MIVSFDNSLIMWQLEPSGTSTMELFLQYQLTALFIFAKKPIVTVRLGSKYATVIINLISTSATQLYSKIAKINEIFIVTPHFFLKLVQKLIKKALIFLRSLLTAHKDKFMSIQSPKQVFWLAPNVTYAQKRAPRYPQPCNLVPRAIFFKK